MSPTSQLWSVSNDLLAEIQKWILTNDGKHQHLHFRRIDQARLLNLKVWSVRHCVSIQEMLTLIVPHIRLGMSHKNKSNYGLGISIRSLTSKHGENVLIEQLAKRYPDGEHIAAWREHLRDQQMDAEKNEDMEGLNSRKNEIHSLLESSSVRDFISSYRARIESCRNVQYREMHSNWRKRKPYRGNPWL